MIVVRGQYIKIDVPEYKIWFRPGGGGNWVSYLIWCWRNNCIIPGDHAHFSVPILSSINPDYHPTMLMLKHDTPLNRADIVLGSNRAKHNRWFMNNFKNGVGSGYQDYTYEDEEYFDLDWADIVENPENFLQTLNSKINEEIKFNTVVEQAWMQYLEVSYPPGTRGLEYLTNPIFDIAVKNIYNTQTNKDLSIHARMQQARELFDARWIKCNPATWAS